MGEAGADRLGALDFVALAHEAYDLWNSEGIDAFAERWWAPDILWEEPQNFPEAATRHGRDACVRRMKERFEPLGHVTVEVMGVRPLRERIALQELTVGGRGSASGAEVEMRVWMIAELGDRGQALWMREFIERQEAEQAAEEIASERADAG